MSDLSDHVLLIAAFNAVCALAEKVTGEKMIVTIKVDGHDMRIFGDDVTWVPTSLEEPQSQGADRLE